MHASFTISDDEELQDDNSTQQQSVKHLHLRVYNAGSSRTENENSDEDGGTVTGRVDILKTILTNLDGVKNVTISKSHLPPRAEYDDFTTAMKNVELVDPTSCMVKIDYGSSSTNNNLGSSTATTDNPQEPKEDEECPIRQAILTRISEAGFDYAVVVSNANGSNGHDDASLSSLLPNNTNPSTPFLCLPITEPPMSCRTRLRVQGICCSSEVPVVRSILKPLPGVRKVGINIATKVVFIDHDPGIISATLLAGALNDQKFSAEILTDGGLELRNSSSGSFSDNTSSPTSPFLDNILDLPRSRFVESTFFIPGMINYNKDKIESCPIGKLVRQNFFKNHLRAFHLHAPSRTLKVEHDPELLNAEKIMDVLVRGEY